MTDSDHPARPGIPEPALEPILAGVQNLTRILDALTAGVVVLDRRRRIRFFNRAAERITGYRQQEVLGRDCHAVLGCPLCGDACGIPPANDAGPADTGPHGVNLTTRGGEVRRLEVTVSVLRDQRRQPVGTLASFEDATDLLALRRQTGRLTGFAGIIGRDVHMLRVFEQIRDVAPYDYPVHVSGDTGTGKELVANAVHRESRRAGAPFVPINCGALPEGLIESELFGHVRGAFSGALRTRKGRFELADGGTVFLDEVAELSKLMQVKLLRFLQEGRFEPVGSEQTRQVDVRLISATNRDLRSEVVQGRFREDLYYRLNVIPIHIPPLRQRRTDIPLLVDHFLREAGERYGHPVPRPTAAAMARLLDYDWPGNVRELQNALQFAIVRSSGGRITPADLPLEFRTRECPGPDGRARWRTRLAPDRVRDALVATAGNKARAARRLGVGRATLYRFLKAQPDLWKAPGDDG